MRKLNITDKHDDLIKSKINIIYSSLNLSNFNYEILTNKDGLLQLLNNPYTISLNFSGTRCLLIFNKINDKYYSYLVNRDKLSYSQNKLNYSTIEITNIDIKLNIDIYKGTILDGIYIKGKSKNTFVITDVFYFEGINKTKDKIIDKLNYICEYLQKYYIQSDKTNNIELTVNQLFDITKIKQIVYNEIPLMRNYPVSGISFYPELSGKKLHFLFKGILPKNKELIKQSDPIKISDQLDVVEKISLDFSVPKHSHKIYIPNKNFKDTDYVF